MSSRSRRTSDDEQALFHTALKDVRPLKKRARAAAPKPVRLSPPPHRIAPPQFNEMPAPMIGGHDEARLRRGRGEPEGRLDLHGLTQDAAYRAAVGFLMAAQAGGKRLVLIITGKGGVLRGQLPLWLGQGDFRGLIGGVSEAHVRHGGSGAFYVALRRRSR